MFPADTTESRFDADVPAKRSVRSARRAIAAGALALTFGGQAIAQTAATPSSPHGGGPPAIPEASRGFPVDPDSGYVREALGAGLHWVGNGAYMSMFLVGAEGVALVDAPPSLAQALLEAVAEVTDLPVTHIVYSYGHGDHIGAAGLFDGATIVAHADTARQLLRGGWCVEECVDVPDPRPAPDILFEQTYTLDLGTVDGAPRTLELAHPGPNHQPGNSIVFHPGSRTLMAVDIVYPGWVPFDLLAVSADIPGWMDAHDALLDYDFDRFIGGHLGRPGNRDDVMTAKAFLDDLVAEAARALSDNPRGEAIGSLGARFGFDNGWWLTDQHTRAVSEDCAAALIERWSVSRDNLREDARQSA